MKITTVDMKKVNGVNPLKNAVWTDATNNEKALVYNALAGFSKSRKHAS